MKEFSVPMALFDLLPVALFTAGSFLIAKDLNRKMGRINRLIFVIGLCMTAAAGLIKALYKLFYAVGAGDYEWMSRQFFSNQAFGFLLAGLALTWYVTRNGNKLHALLPTMSLVAIMVVGLGALDASLAYLAAGAKKKGALVCFIVSFFLCLGMGYLSTKDFSGSSMNWIAQGVNFAGQGLFCLGCFSLHKAFTSGR